MSKKYTTNIDGEKNTTWRDVYFFRKHQMPIEIYSSSLQHHPKFSWNNPLSFGLNLPFYIGNHTTLIKNIIVKTHHGGYNFTNLKNNFYMQMVLQLFQKTELFFLYRKEEICRE